MENREEERLSTESIIMFVMCFVTVGILLICLFFIICCNCINSTMGEWDARPNAMSTRESGEPILLKENPTSVTWLKKTNSWRKQMSKMAKRNRNIVWV